MARAEAGRGLDGLPEIVARGIHRIGHRLAEGEMGCDGAGEGTARTVGVAGFDARALEQPLAMMGLQHIHDHRPADMPALDQRAEGAALQEGLGGPALAVHALHRPAGEDLRFRRIRGHQAGAGNEFRCQRLHGLALNQAVAARRHHDRVDHPPGFGRAFGQGLGDLLDQPGRGQHAGLDRVGTDIGERGCDLAEHGLKRYGPDAVQAARILHGDGGDRRHGIAPRGGDRLDVGLYARPAGIVRASDDEDAALLPASRFAHPQTSTYSKDFTSQVHE